MSLPRGGFVPFKARPKQSILPQTVKPPPQPGTTGTGDLVASNSPTITSPTLVTPVLGVATATSINKVIVTPPASTATLTIVNNKVLTVNNSITLAGTDSTVMTFPTTSASLARTDASNIFTGHQTVEGVTSTGATGTGKFVFDGTPTLTTPVINQPTINGTTTNNNAAAGVVGEYVESNIPSGSAVSLTTDTSTNVTSIALTVGDWDVSGNCTFTGNTTTTVNYLICSFNTTTATIGTTGDMGRTDLGNTGGTLFVNNPVSLVIGPKRISIASPVTLYFIGRAGFGISTCSVYGTVRARRVR